MAHPHTYIIKSQLYSTNCSYGKQTPHPFYDEGVKMQCQRVKHVKRNKTLTSLNKFKSLSFESWKPEINCGLKSPSWHRYILANVSSN